MRKEKKKENAGRNEREEKAGREGGIDGELEGRRETSTEHFLPSTGCSNSSHAQRASPQTSSPALAGQDRGKENAYETKHSAKKWGRRTRAAALKNYHTNKRHQRRRDRVLVHRIPDALGPARVSDNKLSQRFRPRWQRRFCRSRQDLALRVVGAHVF